MIQRHEILSEFKKFLAAPIPRMMAAYGDDHARIIARVFVVVKSSGLLIDMDNKELDEEYTFPIAKVYHVGAKWDGPALKVGDYVRLSDQYALKQYNSRYEVSINNPYSKSNIKDQMVNPLPPKYIMNLWAALGSKLFNPDPFGMDGGRWMSDIFYLDSGNVICPIVDTNEFFIEDKL